MWEDNIKVNHQETRYDTWTGLIWIWWGKLRKRDHFKDLNICGKITLKRTIKKQDMMHGLD